MLDSYSSDDIQTQFQCCQYLCDMLLLKMMDNDKRISPDYVLMIEKYIVPLQRQFYLKICPTLLISMLNNNQI
jgi:hypothetical protein